MCSSWSAISTNAPRKKKEGDESLENQRNKKKDKEEENEWERNKAIAVACFAFDCLQQQQQNPWKLSS